MKYFFNKVNYLLRYKFFLFILSFFIFTIVLSKIFPVKKIDNFSREVRDGNYLSNAVTFNSPVYNDSVSRNVTNKKVSVSNFSSKSINSRKLSWKFSLDINVDNIVEYQSKVEKITEENNGYIESFSSNIYNDRKIINLSIKIPQENVNKFLFDLKSGNNVKSESYYTIDYTEKYNDNSNRLKNLYARRDRLRDMMTFQTKNLSDIISVEKELSNVQLDIENLEKSNMKIDKEVEYSDINLNIEPNIKKVNNKWSFISEFYDAINLLIIFCMTIFHYFVVFIVFVPIFLIFLVISIIIRKIYYIFKNKFKK